jgi:hypothetical protein
MVVFTIPEPHVDAAIKDMDLCQLPGSSNKRRPSMESGEQPPPKKRKTEVFDWKENKENWEPSRRRRARKTSHLSPITADGDSQGIFAVVFQYRFVTMFTRVHDKILFTRSRLSILSCRIFSLLMTVDCVLSL